MTRRRWKGCSLAGKEVKEAGFNGLKGRQDLGRSGEGSIQREKNSTL